MIPIWLNRSAGRSIHDQLTAQLLLGVLSGSIAPGHRLPSVRSLARRLSIHPNTVSGAYRELARSGWIETKVGRGAFAPEAVPESVSSIYDCARLSLRRAAELGFTPRDLMAAIERLSSGNGCTLLVTDPDRELARILAAEIKEAIPCRVECVALDEFPEHVPEGSIPIVSARQAPLFRARWPHSAFRYVYLHTIPEMLAGAPKISSSDLVAFVSRSPVLHQWARTLAPVLGVPQDSIIFRNPAEPHWRAGLNACSLIATDVVSAVKVLTKRNTFVARLIASSSLEDIRLQAGQPALVLKDSAETG